MLDFNLSVTDLDELSTSLAERWKCGLEIYIFKGFRRRESRGFTSKITLFYMRFKQI